MATQIPLVVIGGNVQQIPSGDAFVVAVSNVIAVATTISADTSYVVVDYLQVDADLVINGNIGVI